MINFKIFNIKLPLATRILIRFLEITQHYWLFILIVLILLIIFIFLLNKIRAVKLINHRIILKLPIIGSILQNINLSQFSRTLGVLLKSGLPLVRALEITQATLENSVYQRELAEIGEEVKMGKPISDYLKKRENLFPSMISRMVGVGEKTGSLSETLLYVGDFYEAEVDKSTKNLSTLTPRGFS